jgi:hypothetical protein
MLGPALAVRRFLQRFLQPPAGVGLEVRHHLLRRRFGMNDNVDVIRSDMDGEQPPAAMGGHFPNHLQNDLSTGIVQRVGRVAQLSARRFLPRAVGRKKRSTRLVVLRIH